MCDEEQSNRLCSDNGFYPQHTLEAYCNLRGPCCPTSLPADRLHLRMVMGRKRLRGAKRVSCSII